MAYSQPMATPDLTALIERAIRDRHVLRVTYHALDDAVVVQDIEPLAIRFNHAKHRVLWCWSRDVGHIEELIWDGIESAVDTGETFAPRPWVEP
jgi:predicted DNA-binding transcriptional regulator YafY